MVKKKKTHHELFTGKEARLLNEACQLVRDNEILADKRQEEINKIVAEYKPQEDKNNKRFEKVKGKLGKLKDGEYTTKKSKSVVVTTKEKRSEPTVDRTRKWLKDKRRGKLFDTVIKVQLTLLRKVMSDLDIEEITDVVEKKTTWKFK